MELQAFELGVGQADDPSALWRLFTAFFRPTVVTRINYHHLPPLGAPDADQVRLATDGFPEELVTRYVTERRWRDNPIVTYSQKHADPVYWDEVGDLKPLTEREASFIEAIRSARIGDGVGIPAFGPNGRNGSFGLGFVDGVRRLPPGTMRDFQWVCQLAHLRYCALILPTLGPPPQLSPRETEVLVWVARGKSNGAIAEILGISAHTVDAHLRRIYLKLGVFDRLSAAIRGIGIGLIHAET
jgi:LuxR family transcriptional regulator, quorum-sensing system regulator CciR